MNLSKSAKATRVMNSVTAGTSNQSSSSVDMKGFESVQFVVAFGAITSSAVTSCKLQTSSDDSNFNDLKGTLIAVADDDDNQIVVLDLSHPLERYLKVIVNRATQNSVIDGVFAFQYEAKAEPVTHDSSTVVGFELSVSPIEGTA